MAYTCGSAVRIQPSTLTNPRSSSTFVVSRPISSEFGARPVATSSCSTVSSSAAPPSGPTVSVTPSSATRTVDVVEAGLRDDLDPAPD